MIDGEQPDGPERPAAAVEPGPPADPAPATGGPETEWYCSCGPPRSLRWLAEDFAANLAASAAIALRQDVGICLTGSAASCRAEFARAVEEPTCCYLLTARGDLGAPGGEGPGAAVWLEFSPVIALTVVECLLGGAATNAPPTGRALRPVERRVLYRLAELSARSLSAAWPGAAGPEFRAEPGLPPQVGAADGPAVVVTFELTLCGRAGTLRLCGAREMMQDCLPGAGRRRSAAANVGLSAALEGIALEDGELAGLTGGDVITTGIAADGEVIVRVGGIPKYAARLGTSGGRKSLTITRRLVGGSQGSVRPPEG